MAEYNLQQLNEMYVDVLREIGNIGAGNATTAVSQMLNTKIEIVKLLPVEEIGSVMGDEEQTIVGIFLGVEGDINGSMMFLMDMTSAHQMVNRLMMRDPDYAGDFDEMDQSAIREIGNIIASSYLSALSGLTGLYISPTVPFLAVDMAAAILSVPAVQFGMMGDQALLIETEFGDDKKLSGYYILMPEEDSYEKILTSLGISL